MPKIKEETKMCNATWHKLCYEFDLNYEYNEDFRNYANANYPHRTDMYGSEEFMPEVMRQIRKDWKSKVKTDKNLLWWNNHDELYAWLDAD